MRCAAHQHIGPLIDGLECTVCVAEKLIDGLNDRLFREHYSHVFDGYAERLTYGAYLRAKLADARARLNLLSPGAGDYLDGDVAPHVGALDETASEL